MAIVINTNTLALTAQNSLNKAQSSMTKALERLSTGYKINRAGDDAAGLSIATNLNTQIRGSQVAKDNIQQGVNVLSTTEGAIGSINDNITRIRELSLQAANGINSSDSTKAIIKEMTARLSEIDKTAQSTQFNGLKLLDGSITNLRLQVGANSDATENSITVTDVFSDCGTANLDIQLPADLQTYDSNEKAVTAAASYVDKLDKALTTLVAQRSAIGAYTNRLESNTENLNTTITNMQASKSTIMDADVATESSEFTKQSILQQASASLLAQANQVPAIALKLLG
ncbi:MAG: flagellin [Candidatus Gastranaerophilales bacterium]|nr:flagellin [Candidatus Gastranaerophilales bacterium]